MKKVSLGAGIHVVPSPVWLISSYDIKGKTNIMSASWCGVACTTPACLGVSIKKSAYTHSNLLARKAFTVTIATSEYTHITDICGSCSGRDNDKYKLANLSAVRGEYVDAPYPFELPLIIECVVIKEIDIGSHTQFVGEIKDVKASIDILLDSNIDITKLSPLLACTTDRAYYTLGKMIRKLSSL